MKIDVKSLITTIESVGGIVKPTKYSKWLTIKREGATIKMQDTVTLFQVDLFGKLTFIVTRDATKTSLGAGEGNGLLWIKENEYMLEKEWIKENNSYADEYDENEE